MIGGGGAAGILAVHHQLANLRPTELPKFRGFKLHSQLQRWHHPSRRLNLNSMSGKMELHLTIAASAAASSPSFGGSDAEYSEKLLGPKPREKKQKIAGIDQDELLDPELLADPDSCFCEFKGVQIHHKVYDAESPTHNLSQNQPISQSSSSAKKVGLPMILLHGFGASLFSWHRVMKSLAHITGSKVLAFDRPAFGLTSRVNPFKCSSPGREKPLNPYSMLFSVLATLFFIDSIAAEKAILVGHSAGALVAVNAYFEAPERIAALILVAPAILGPLIAPKAKGNQFGRDAQIQEDGSTSVVGGNIFIRLLSFLSKISLAIITMMRGMLDMLNSFYKKALSAILRSSFVVMLVRIAIDKFGIAGIRNAWYDPNQVTDHVLKGYTKPLKAKGWDRALAEYTAAMLADPTPESKPSLTSRLKEISCPVLIITGDTDRLVPSWNAERLSRAIPGSFLEVIKNCGHIPHEEKAEEFVSIIEKFLQRVCCGTQQHHLQPAT